MDWNSIFEVIEDGIQAKRKGADSARSDRWFVFFTRVGDFRIFGFPGSDLGFLSCSYIGLARHFFRDQPI